PDPTKIKIKPPKIKIELPKVEAPKVKPPEIKPPKPKNLFKRLADIIKFQKFAHENERKRVTVFVNQLISDSIAATNKNVDFLVNYLSDTVNQNIDNLKDAVDFLRASDSSLFSQISDINANARASQADIDTKLGLIRNYAKAGPDRDAYIEASEKKLNALASKIFPVIIVGPNLKEMAERNARLKLLRNTMDSADIWRTDTVDGVQRRYKIRLKNKIPVYGFYNAATGTALQWDKLSYLNTFIYNSVVINSQTGDVAAMNDWERSTVVNSAQTARCNIVVTFTTTGRFATADFLKNPLAQDKFIETGIYLMKYRNATGINIAFENFEAGLSRQYTNFIAKLYQRLKEKDPRFSLFLTIPAMINDNDYSLAELRLVSDHAIVDFSTNYSITQAGPLASIDSMAKITAYFQAYGPEKLIFCLPYKGTKWSTINGYKDRFIEYITYKTIRDRYPFHLYTTKMDSTTVTMEMDSLYSLGYVARRIFYDDENTIGKKYQFILDQKLGGAAVNGLGDDFGYMGLWDEMMYAFAEPSDTTFDIPYSKPSLAKTKDLGFFDILARRYALYTYILQHPCEKCYDNIADSAEREKMLQYVADLDIPHKCMLANEERAKNNERPYRSDFEYVSMELTHFLLVMTITIAIILIALIALYLYQLNRKAELWKWKKQVQYLTIGVSVLLILTFFALLFSTDLVPFFGASSSTHGPVAKEYTSEKALKIAEAMHSDYCIVDPASECVNMPLTTLLMIVSVVLVIGFLITKYLIFPMMKKEHP
ncbi:MAG TPA: glycosyl hydrolase family 18 protein, partial [Ferruginibacter sp.]|nr:glycosyl hydrolase family 18 protein [Ferruginibacter sp.]